MWGNKKKLYYLRSVFIFFFQVLEDADMNNILNYDSYLSDYGPKNFRGAGTTFKFSKKNERETITARGPLTESLTLLVSNQYTINILEACNSTNLVVALLNPGKGSFEGFLFNYVTNDVSSETSCMFASVCRCSIRVVTCMKVVRLVKLDSY